jgi:hypothetical protein
MRFRTPLIVEYGRFEQVGELGSGEPQAPSRDEQPHGLIAGTR